MQMVQEMSDSISTLGDVGVLLKYLYFHKNTILDIGGISLVMNNNLSIDISGNQGDAPYLCLLNIVRELKKTTAMNNIRSEVLYSECS